MVTKRPPHLRIIVVSALVALLPVLASAADAPKVTAVLNRNTVSVGQMAQMQIHIIGATDASIPEEISVDGLEMRLTDTSSFTEMNNFKFSSHVTYTYTILPLRPGTFKIPPQSIKVAGQTLQTEELRLNVSGSSNQAPTQGRTNRAPSPNTGNNTAPATEGQKIAFAELVVPKQTAYVGEMVPVEIRLGFYSRARGRLVDGPEITGQGFTTQKLQQTEQPRLENVNGKTYEVWTFKTAIAAARPGKFEIGPVQAGAIVAVPRTQPRSRGRSPFDIFNMDDPFSDPFFADPFGSFGQQEKIAIKSEPVSLEVKPLPGNAPADFNGAVGNFALTVDANPKSVQTGDPITVTASVSGRGNFDRVTAPTLQDERGWHKYPPTSKFKQDDDVGISGNKTFETVISPNEKKTAVPAFGFSYFDPIKEQYVSLKSDAIPVRVEGGSVATATPSSSASAAAPAAAQPSPTPQAPSKPNDILYQLNERPKTPQSFAPLYLRKTFWIGQLVPLLALLAFGAWKARQARRQNRAAIRAEELQREAADLLRKLRHDGASSEEYYANASRAVQIKTALMTAADPNSIDVETVERAFRLDENARARLRQLFERSDELRYSGGVHNGSDSISPEQQRDVLDLIENLRA